MKKMLCIFLLLICLYPAILYAGTPIYRYGLFVASSKGYNLPTLPTAGKVVKGVVELFEEYCKVERYQFLEDPAKEALNLAFDKAAQIIETRNKDFETQFFFYYFGHGIPEGLFLGNELYSKSLLKEKMVSLGAQIKFIFIDACTSEILGENGYIDFSTPSTGTVFITSSTLFQNSYADIFTPVLKAGLMGDADGYIPAQFPVRFFYNEVIGKLDNCEREAIRNLYDFKEYYDYTRETPQIDLKAGELFTSLGMETIPPRLHIKTLQEEIFPRLNNILDKQLIEGMYNYSEVCRQNTQLSQSERVLLNSILEKAGIKKDNFITLTELFSYLRERVSSSKVIQQTPTININNLLSKEPVRLSYIDNKIPLILTLPGTIYINRIVDGNIIENLAKLFPRLGDNAPARIALPPGKYTIVAETEDFKYRIEQKLFPGSGEIILEQPDWSSVVAYREEVMRNGIREEQWIEKAVIENKVINEKNSSQFFSLSAALSITIPVTLLLSGFYYSDLTDKLYTQYQSTIDPYEAAALHSRILNLEETTKNLYIWTAVSAILPVLSFSGWLISQNKYKQYNADLESIKHRQFVSCLPDIQLDGEKLIFAFRWQL